MILLFHGLNWTVGCVFARSSFFLVQFDGCLGLHDASGA